MAEVERFLVEFGGDERTGTGERVWIKGEFPPPVDMEFQGKKYRRVSFSEMPADVPGIIRGAKYLEASDA